MDFYTLEQRIKVLQTYYKTSQSLKTTYLKNNNFFGVNISLNT